MRTSPILFGTIIAARTGDGKYCREVRLMKCSLVVPEVVKVKMRAAFNATAHEDGVTVV